MENLPEGYQQMIMMKFSVHSQKADEVKDKYETFLDQCINNDETKMKFVETRMGLFTSADANADGYLDYDEFKSYYEKLGAWNDSEFGGHDQFTEEQLKSIYDLTCQGDAKGVSLAAFQ